MMEMVGHIRRDHTKTFCGRPVDEPVEESYLYGQVCPDCYEMSLRVFRAGPKLRYDDLEKLCSAIFNEEEDDD